MKMASKHPVLVGTVLVLLASVSVYGCKDFLNSAASPQGTLNEQSLANANGVEGTLVAAYRPLDCTSATNGNWGCAASNWVWGTVAADDAYKGSNATDQPPINDVEAYHWGTPDADSYLNNKWVNVYEGVVRANSPYYREDDTDFRKPNIAPADVVTEILKDLDLAISKLPATPRNGQLGRATSWTAKAYKGRVQVYAGQYAAGLATLKDVVANGPYALEASYDRVWTGFKDYANGKETIFAYEASANDGEPNGNNSNFGERLNFPYSGSHFGCCGFNQPSQNLVNFFKVDAAGLPLAVSSPTSWNAFNGNFDATTKDPVDPRLDWTVGRDGVPYKDWGLYSVASGWVRDPDNGGPYGPKKNAHEKASGAESSVGWQNTQLNAVHIHLFRYADLLLLVAEAEVEAGSIDNARTIVNQIRARAGVKAQGTGADRASIAVPINDPSITWAVYKVGPYPAFASQTEARTAVRNERRLELAMEGQRMFDLRRWGIADVVLNAYVNGVGGGAEKTRRLYKTAAEPVAARHKWYPLPSLQIELSKVSGTSTLKQNTGW